MHGGIPKHNTYSFLDLSCVLSHPSLGQLALQGEGAVSITFTMAADVSAQDSAADGTVMTSKISVRNGTVAIVVQQTSSFHRWLTNAYNYLVEAASGEWTGFNLMCVAPNMQVTHEAGFMCFQKRADKPYQAQGQQVTWNFMASELKEYV